MMTDQASTAVEYRGVAAAGQRSRSEHDHGSVSIVVDPPDTTHQNSPPGHREMPCVFAASVGPMRKVVDTGESTAAQAKGSGRLLTVTGSPREPLSTLAVPAVDQMLTRGGDVNQSREHT